MSDIQSGSPTYTDPTAPKTDSSSRLASAKVKASEAYRTARERTNNTIETAREKASSGIYANPVAALLGGLAIGGLLAAILPRTQREIELLGTYGRKLNDGARQALMSAKEEAAQKLDELGYNSENAKSKISALRGDVAEIASAAAKRARGTGQA